MRRWCFRSEEGRVKSCLVFKIFVCLVFFFVLVFFFLLFVSFLSHSAFTTQCLASDFPKLFIIFILGQNIMKFTFKSQ